MLPRTLISRALLSLAFCGACTPSDGVSSTVAPDASARFVTSAPAPDPTVTWKLPLNDGALAFRSDRQSADGTYSSYANGACGVTTWIEMSTSDPFPGDAHVSLASAKKGCGRTLTLVYPDGVKETAIGNSNLRKLESRDTVIAVGATEKRTLAINLGSPGSTRCGRVLFGEGSAGAGVGSDSVLVTRLDARTWHVQSNTGHTLALCENTNVLYSMPVDFMLVADRTDLP
jgi:hypothetical protein